MSHQAYIGFGSNLGDRKAKFSESLAALGELPHTRVKSHSRLYETEPVGLSDGGETFLNAAVALETDLSPNDLIEFLRGIERKLGKSPLHQSDRSRVIDLDLLLFDERIIQEEGLQVPHARMHLRGFVLAPLVEIAPLAVHPDKNCTVERLLSILPVEELKGVRPLISSEGT